MNKQRKGRRDYSDAEKDALEDIINADFDEYAATQGGGS